MKYLLLNRHAKSPWKNIHVSDHDRELNEKGFSDSTMMGKRLLDKKIKFDAMISSSALRALSTCQLIALEIGFNIEDIDVNKDIYGANHQELKKIISKTDNKIKNLAIFGHNPTLHVLSEKLYGKVIERFPSCSMIFVEFKTNDWSDCFNSNREVVFFDYPGNV